MKSILLLFCFATKAISQYYDGIAYPTPMEDANLSNFPPINVKLINHQRILKDLPPPPSVHSIKDLPKSYSDDERILKRNKLPLASTLPFELFRDQKLIPLKVVKSSENLDPIPSFEPGIHFQDDKKPDEPKIEADFSTSNAIPHYRPPPPMHQPAYAKYKIKSARNERFSKYSKSKKSQKKIENFAPTNSKNDFKNYNTSDWHATIDPSIRTRINNKRLIRKMIKNRNRLIKIARNQYKDRQNFATKITTLPTTRIKTTKIPEFNDFNYIFWSTTLPPTSREYPNYMKPLEVVADPPTTLIQVGPKGSKLAEAYARFQSSGQWNKKKSIIGKKSTREAIFDEEKSISKLGTVSKNTDGPIISLDSNEPLLEENKEEAQSHWERKIAKSRKSQEKNQKTGLQRIYEYLNHRGRLTERSRLGKMSKLSNFDDEQNKDLRIPYPKDQRNFYEHESKQNKKEEIEKNPSLQPPVPIVTNIIEPPQKSIDLKEPDTKTTTFLFPKPSELANNMNVYEKQPLENISMSIETTPYTPKIRESIANQENVQKSTTEKTDPDSAKSIGQNSKCPVDDENFCKSINAQVTIAEEETTTTRSESDFSGSDSFLNEDSNLICKNGYCPNKGLTFGTFEPACMPTLKHNCRTACEPSTPQGIRCGNSYSLECMNTQYCCCPVQQISLCNLIKGAARTLGLCSG